VIYILLFFIELLVLWVLATTLSGKFLTRIPVWLYAILFLPGTFVHEFSHFLMAKLLFVRVGKFSLIAKRTEREILLGSVSIEKVGFARKFLIRIAPVIFGATFIVLIIHIAILHSFLQSWQFFVFIGYAVFVVSNSLFSVSDLKGIPFYILLSAVAILLMSALGVRINLGINQIEILRTMCLYLLVPIILDSMILVVLRLFKR
jgi:hypothetical protein